MQLLTVFSFLGIASLRGKYFRVNLSDVQTNIVRIYLEPRINPKEVQKRLATIYPTDPVKVCVKCSSRSNWLRFVTHWEVTGTDCTLAIQKIVVVFEEFEKQLEGHNVLDSQQLDRAYTRTQAVLEAQNKRSKL